MASSFRRIFGGAGKLDRNAISSQNETENQNGFHTEEPAATSVHSPESLDSMQALREQYENIIRVKGNTIDPPIEAMLSELREMVLFHGLPNETEEEKQRVLTGNGCTLRGELWKVFLRVKVINGAHYLDLLDHGATEQYKEIVVDAPRTFGEQSLKEYAERVPLTRFRRLLNAFSLSNGGLKKISQFTYRQGMDSLCVPFLVVMSEVDAFFAYERFLKELVPTYVSDTNIGAHVGVKLLYRVLRVVDPELGKRFEKDTITDIRIFSFSPILSLLAKAGPLDEVLRLWDFFFAFGFHNCVLCVAAMVLIHRDEILAMKPNLINPTMVEQVKKVNTRSLITIAMTIMRELPAPLYDSIVKHTFDMGLCQRIFYEDQ